MIILSFFFFGGGGGGWVGGWVEFKTFLIVLVFPSNHLALVHGLTWGILAWNSQNLRHHEDETRRASSYHSYSQSPPYDYQYEERRYGKQAHALTRKPGSDRGLYEGRLSSFFSPSRFSDQMHEDSFANEGSNPRASDYSVSSAGDPFRSDAQSPNFQRDIGMRSPPQVFLF